MGVRPSKLLIARESECGKQVLQSVMAFPNDVWRSHHQNHTRMRYRWLMNEEPMGADKIPLSLNSTGPASKLSQGHQHQCNQQKMANICVKLLHRAQMRCGGIALAMWACLQKLEQRCSRTSATLGSTLPTSLMVDNRVRALNTDEDSPAMEPISNIFQYSSTCLISVNGGHHPLEN